MRAEGNLMPELCRNEEIRVAAEPQQFNRRLGRLTGMARHSVRFARINRGGLPLGVDRRLASKTEARFAQIDWAKHAQFEPNCWMRVASLAHETVVHRCHRSKI
jgi:hypothetical protein